MLALALAGAFNEYPFYGMVLIGGLYNAAGWHPFMECAFGFLVHCCSSDIVSFFLVGVTLTQSSVPPITVL